MEAEAAPMAEAREEAEEEQEEVESLVGEGGQEQQEPVEEEEAAQGAFEEAQLPKSRKQTIDDTPTAEAKVASITPVPASSAKRKAWKSRGVSRTGSRLSSEAVAASSEAGSALTATEQAGAATSMTSAATSVTSEVIDEWRDAMSKLSTAIGKKCAVKGDGFCWLYACLAGAQLGSLEIYTLALTLALDVYPCIPNSHVDLLCDSNERLAESDEPNPGGLRVRREGLGGIEGSCSWRVLCILERC